MFSCPRLICHEEFETMASFMNHMEQNHYKFKCEICPKRTKSESGLKIHKTRMHREYQNNLLNVKNEAIREAQKCGASFQNVRKNYKEYDENQQRQFSIENNLNLVNVFRVRPTKISFEAFKERMKNDKVTIKVVLSEMIAVVNDDITDFWSRILNFFRQDLLRFSAQKNMDVFQFELENNGEEKYCEQVERYRQSISACFKIIIEIFEDENTVEDNNLVEASVTNKIVDKLTLRKLQIEVMCDISLSTNYISNIAPRIVSMCYKVQNNDRMSKQERISNLFEIKKHVEMIYSTIENIKTEHISEHYEDIIETVMEKMKEHKTIVDTHFNLVQAERILPPFENRENLLPQSSRQSEVKLFTVADDSEDDDTDVTDYDTDSESENGEVDVDDHQAITINDDNTDTESEANEQLIIVSDDDLDDTESDEVSLNDSLSTVSPESSTQSERESTPTIVTLYDDDDENYLDEGPVNDVPNNIIEDKKVVGSRINVATVKLDRLILRRWLNDEIIQVVLQLLNKSNTKYLCYDTNFFRSFSRRGFEGVERHYRRENAMAKEKILIPVCQNAHWFLIVLDLKNYQLHSFDALGSMESKHDETLEKLRHIRDNYFYPLFESEGKSVPNISLNVWLPPTIPEQKDGYNCGVWLLAFAKAIFFERENFDFQSEDMDPFRDILVEEINTQQITKKIRQTDQDTEEVEEILYPEENVQPVAHNTSEAVPDTQHQVEETDEQREEQADTQPETDEDTNFAPVPLPPQEVQEILDSLENVETFYNNEQDGKKVVVMYPEDGQEMFISREMFISTPINSPISDFNRDVRFSESYSNQMNIIKELSPTVNEESLNTHRQPYTNKKRNLEETFQYKDLTSISQACKKFKLGNIIESDVVDEEDENQHEVDDWEAEGPQTLEDVLMPRETATVTAESHQNEEQEMVVQDDELEHETQAEGPQTLQDLLMPREPAPITAESHQNVQPVADEQISENNEEQMVVDILQEPEPQIKINGKMLTVFMKKEHYFNLSKHQKIDISKKMEGSVRYHAKDIMRRQKFTADKENILKYLEHVEEKNLAVTFNFDCFFDKPVVNEEHEREVFEDMLSDENIDRKGQFPLQKYFFVDITISQFKTFLTIFN